MTTTLQPRRAAQRSLLAALGLSALLTARSIAQAPTVPGAARAAQDLARYDKNKNGQLDADELAAQQANETKAAKAATANARRGYGSRTLTVSSERRGR